MRKSSRQIALNRRVEVVTQSAIACGLMLWGMVNFWSTAFDDRNPQVAEGEPSWWVAYVFVIFTALLPFGLGVWRLLRAFSKRDLSK